MVGLLCSAICLPDFFDLCHSVRLVCNVFLFFFNDAATTEIYTLSLHDALPIFGCPARLRFPKPASRPMTTWTSGTCRRSEEHTSELQSRFDLVCRLLLEKKKQITNQSFIYDTNQYIHPYI